MTKIKHTGTYYISIILMICMCFMSSCTYDYFDDETNYVVYVPKADENERTDTYKIEDLTILIYNPSSLEKERRSSFPFDDNARTRVGNFNFKLFPGEHSVFCLTNTSGLEFAETNSFTDARFTLKQEGEYYIEPSVVLLDTMKPLILFPGPVITDIAYFEKKYVGRICVVFKNLTNINSNLTYSNINKVEAIVEGIGTKQYLSHIMDSTKTRSSRNSSADRMFISPQLYDNPYQDFDFGFDSYYFPSPDLTEEGQEMEPIRFHLNFYDSNGNLLNSNPLESSLTDRATGKPIPLHMNQTLILAIDGNTIQVLTLDNPLDWDSTVEKEKDNTPGGGTEI